MLNSISFFYFKHLFIKFLKNYNFETLNKNLNSVEDLIALICKGKVPKKSDQEEYDFKIKIERGEESDSSPRLKKNSNQEDFDV